MAIQQSNPEVDPASLRVTWKPERREWHGFHYDGYVQVVWDSPEGPFALLHITRSGLTEENLDELRPHFAKLVADAYRAHRKPDDTSAAAG